MGIFEIILALFLPPVAIAIRYGLGGAFWLNVLLTLIGFIPGVIHAFYVLTE